MSDGRRPLVPELGRALTPAESERVRRHRAEAAARRAAPESAAPEPGDEPTGRHSILPDVAQLVSAAVRRELKSHEPLDDDGERTVRRLKVSWSKRLVTAIGVLMAIGTLVSSVVLGSIAVSDWAVKRVLVRTGLRCPEVDEATLRAQGPHACKEIPQTLRDIQSSQAETNSKLDALLRRDAGAP